MFFLVYLNIWSKSIAITDSMFNFDKYLTKHAITFDLTEIERIKIYLIAIKNLKIAKKKSTFFPKKFQQKEIFAKSTDLKKTHIFLDSGGSSRQFRSSSKAINQLFPT